MIVLDWFVTNIATVGKLGGSVQENRRVGGKLVGVKVWVHTTSSVLQLLCVLCNTYGLGSLSGKWGMSGV